MSLMKVSEKLDGRGSNRSVLVILAVGLALAVALSMALAGDAEAKKKKKKKKQPQLHQVTCPAYTGAGTVCNGTDLNDLLVGTADYNVMYGKEGNDVYDPKGGTEDYARDISDTSNDSYRVPQGGFAELRIEDHGGAADSIFLGAYRYVDFEYVKVDVDTQYAPGKESLLLKGPANTQILIRYHYDPDLVDGQLEKFVFADGAIDASQIQAL